MLRSVTGKMSEGVVFGGRFECRASTKLRDDSLALGGGRASIASVGAHTLAGCGLEPGSGAGEPAPGSAAGLVYDV